MHTLAKILSLGGLLMGAPSLLGLLVYAVHLVRARFAPPAAISKPVQNPDAVVLTLEMMSRTLAGIGRMVGGAADLLFSGLAIVSVCGVVLGIVFWFTGRGLYAHASWARVSAFVLVGMIFLPSILLALSMHNVMRLLMVVLVVGCGVAFRTLWAGFVPSNL